MGKPLFYSVIDYARDTPEADLCLLSNMPRKGQALQFNYLFEKGAFVLHIDGTFSVNFDKV